MCLYLFLRGSQKIAKLQAPIKQCVKLRNVCRRVLDKYEIGTVHSDAAIPVKTVHYQDYTGEGEFYNVLQRRVEKYFRGNEVRGYLMALLTWCEFTKLLHKFIGAHQHTM